MLTATPLYAGLLGLLLIILSLRVISVRRAVRVSMGDGDKPELRKQIRVQANCAEYAPIGIVLLALAELQDMPLWLAHLFGILLVTGRVLHAFGMGRTPQVIPARIIGMVLTFGAIIALSLANIGHALF